MPRTKMGTVGFGLSARNNLHKNTAINEHKRMVTKNEHYHKKPVVGLKRWYHTKGDVNIGNFSGPDVMGFS